MRNRTLRSILLSTAALIAVAASVTSTTSMAGKSLAPEKTSAAGPNALPTKSPIKHLVVIFNENVSFDHYFATYPNAMNPEGEPRFEPAKNTQADINNLSTNPGLLDNNPNLNPANGTAAANPFRLDRSQANTADQNHGYASEQAAYDGGKNDLFPKDVGKGSSGGGGAFGTAAQVMGYFDGNTVTALWNYAQNYAMSDNAWDDHFGPSTPGALNMFAGQTNGFTLPVGVPPGTPPSTVGQLLLQAGAGSRTAMAATRSPAISIRPATCAQVRAFRCR
jgi:phospholipase C